MQYIRNKLEKSKGFAKVSLAATVFLLLTEDEYDIINKEPKLQN